MNGLEKFLKSPWWKFANSALIVLCLTTLVSMYQTTKNLEIAVDTSNSVGISNKNEVKIINQSITKVETEIANIREAIHQHYNEVVTEVFRQEDKDDKIKIVPIPDQQGQSALFFMLGKIPEEKSIRIITQTGTSVPFTTLTRSRNIVMVQVNGLSELLPKASDYIEVSYTPNFFASGPLFSLQGMEITKRGEGKFDFKLKEK